MKGTIALHGYVRTWLIVGLVLVFFQILIGGVTRLTGSGLSITRWEIVTGTLPPMSDHAWQMEFDRYKGTPQYHLINKGMTLSEFRFIYFWEYLHRLWARWMGLVFLIPFIIFWRKGWLGTRLFRRLLGLIVLAGLAASFGWIMVASGLKDRPWVDAYRLTMHLLLGFSVFLYLLWILVSGHWPEGFGHLDNHSRVFLRRFFWLAVVQVCLGGLMSGMKAGYSYPTWPDMNGEWIPGILWQPGEWNVNNLVEYDSGIFMVSLVQVLHRLLAYLLIIIGLVYYFRLGIHVKDRLSRRFHALWIMVLVTQMVLGILTILSFRQGLPVGLGSAHQMGALLTLGATLVLWKGHSLEQPLSDGNNDRGVGDLSSEFS